MTGQTTLTRAEFEQLLASADLLTVGQTADAARRGRHGDRATYLTVFEVSVEGGAPETIDVPEAAREVRLTGRPASLDAAVAAVTAVRAAAGDRVLTGFSLADMVDLARAEGITLRDAAAKLSGAGLTSLAEVPVDRLDDLQKTVREVTAGGLQAWRAVVERAAWETRLDLIERVAALQRETGALRAFAPLPRIDDREAPSTGFDDVRTIAAARLLSDVPHIQVDWSLYGPKLAQVALTYGADDIDGVSSVDDTGLGWRRAPVADVERNIRAAGQEPAARDGRYDIR